MSNRRKKRAKPAAVTPLKVHGWKLWCFRLLFAAGTPITFFLIVELCLRLAGFGYATNFILRDTNDGRKTFVQNNRFGWRFFGRQMARTPYPFSIPQTKASDTVRIFVFGESAAYGDPQPRFGLPRMLQTILSLRHPGVRFEVVNAAMTGINSHAILPIARDCADAGGDIWVIYMGNNEVVGPYGAGTVFGPQAPMMPLIRGSLAHKATRTGQLLDSARQRLQKPPPEKSEWGGMVMFLDQQVRKDDPRMNAVYDHFRQNLADIIQTGRRSGAGIVVSTVGVNLKDSAPFASAHPPGLPDPDKKKWEELYQSGIDFQNAGKNPEAADRFRAAAKIDDGFAELHFRQAWCALTIHDIPEAQRQFSAARDLDTLRFRCDGQLNDLTRQAGSGREQDHILLADSERAFAEQSPDGLPGEDFFYEHVHLTFEGNYLLASTIAAQVEKLLPQAVAARVAGKPSWPSIEDCARRLSWTEWSRQAVLSDIFARLGDPPFSGQLNHAARLQHLRTLLEKSALAIQPAGISAARNACEAAVAANPDDPELQAQLASLKQLSGDLAGAAMAARREVELLPSSAEGWSQLGLILVQQQQFEPAAGAFRRAFQLDSQDVWSLQNLAQSLAKLGRREDAIQEYQRALKIKPRFGLAWLGLGQEFEAMGRKAEAEDCYRKALANRIHRAPELTTLARFCQSRGWFEAAATNFDEAIKLSPSDAMLHLEAGQNLTAWGHPAESSQHYAEAVRLAPELGQARYLHGLDLGQQGKPAEAAEQFREAVRLMPNVPEARLNLGIALIGEGSNSEALAQFQEVLKQNPTNALALRYTQALRERTSAEPLHSTP